ncbi:retrovirus-related pol polyprotein from transposon TNT 1-94 [Tanacetum coccineum]
MLRISLHIAKKPKVNNKELGHGFTERACFVCGSFSHLIRDCDYHVKLAKQVELNKQNMSKGNGTGERKPTWNNVQRVNKQNQFVPLAVQTRTGNNPVNTAKASSTKNFSTARQNVNRQTVLTSTALKVNTGKRSYTVGEKGDTTVKSSGRHNDKGTRLPSDFKTKGGPICLWRDVIELCGLKGIKREYSNARTPQQNGVAERKNRTLIEAARTMLADSFLPNTFWAEAVSTACYVLNRVLVTKPHNKTPYELLTGKTPIISYIRPFGCHVTILNTIDHLGKFAGKSDEGFLVGYSLQSKAFRAAPMPHESPLQSVYSLGSDEGSLSLHELTNLCTSLSKKVASLESELKQTKQTYNAALIKLINMEAEEVPSNQGRSLIEELDLDARISLVPPHAANQGRINDTQISDQHEKQLGVFSTATALADAARRRQSVENVFEEEQARFNAEQEARFKAEQEQERIDFETTLELQKQLDEREEVASKVDQAHDIDWSDSAVLRYHTLQIDISLCYEDIRIYFEEYGIKIKAFIHMGSEIKKEDRVKEEGKKSLARKRAKETLSEESAKKQKLEDDIEKKELKYAGNYIVGQERVQTEVQKVID